MRRTDRLFRFEKWFPTQYSIALGVTIAVCCVDTGFSQPPQSEKKGGNVQWGSADSTSDDPHAGHNHGEMSLDEFEFTESAAEKRLKAKMTPEERVAYDRQKLEKMQREALARQSKFAVLPEGDDSPLAKEYQAAYDAFKKATTDLVGTYHRYQVIYKPSPKFLADLQEEWLSGIAHCNQMKSQWLTKGSEIFATDTTKYVNIGRALKEILLYDVSHDRFEGWTDAAKRFASSESELVNDEVTLAAGFVCLANNDWDACDQLIGKLDAQGKLTDIQKTFYDRLPELREKWTREVEFRKRDAEKKDNPLIELITTKGRIVIELFEDDAPEAVKSTIYLVERGYYSRKPFFRVEQHVVAQTGCDKGDGSGNAGYTIAGEATLPTHRNHFRGSVAIALGSMNGQVDVNSGGAQFYIAELPLPNLDEQFTVFGRIVEGLDSVGLFRQLNLVNEEEREQKKRPDMILKANVLRKRDHEYKPNPITGKLR